MIHRASSLGGCLKGQCAAALGQKPIPVDDASQLRMNEGEIHERDVIARLTADGYTVTRRQEEVNLVCSPFTYKGGVITPGTPITSDLGVVQGHLDGVVNGDLLNRSQNSRVLEVKSMSDTAWKDFQSKGWHHDWPAGSLIDKYRWQLSVYMLATGLEGLLVTKNRNSGQMTQHGIETPFYTLDQITERVAYIEDHVARGQLPDDCPHDFWCSFRYLCQEKKQQPVVPDTEVELAASLYLAAVAKAKEADTAKSEARTQLEAVLGDRPSVQTNSVSVTSYEQLSPPKLNLDKFRAEGLNPDDYYLPRSKSRRIKVTPQDLHN